MSDLSPDVNAWDPQPAESPEAYKAFCAYRDSMDRKLSSVAEEHPNAYAWSKRWWWETRCYQFDVHMAKLDEAQLIRYRLQMNDAHRRTARLTLGKFVSWLSAAEPGRWSTSDAARMFDLAVKVERLASAGTGVAADLPAPTEDQPLTIADILGADGLDEAIITLHELLPRTQ